VGRTRAEKRSPASGSDKQWKMLRSGSSYCHKANWSQPYGLAQMRKADSIEIQRPSGQVAKVANVNPRQTITVQEGKGIVTTKAYGATSVRKPVASNVAKLTPAVVSPNSHQ